MTQDAGPEAVFEIVARERMFGRLSAPVAEFGVGLGPDQSVLTDNLKVPLFIKQSLAAGLAAAGSSEEPTWILLDRPAGYLPAIPWEQALRPELAMPLLRFPHLLVKPFMPRDYLDLAICFAFPDESLADEVVRKILAAVSTDFAKAVRLHIFANKSLEVICRNVASSLAGIVTTVHVPQQEKNGDVSRNSSGIPALSPLSNPWLQWMSSTLGATSLDCAQFVTHSSLENEQGRLDFAPLVEAENATILQSNAREIAAFLDHAGAWSAAFVAPPSNKSDPGMRMLLDQLGWLRPSPTYVCDLSANDDLSGNAVTLLTANTYILRSVRGSVPNSPALSLMCYPERSVQSPLGWIANTFGGIGTQVISTLIPNSFEETHRTLRNVSAARHMRGLLDEYTLTNRLQDVLASEKNPPAEIAAMQRALERVLAQARDPLEDPEVRRTAEEVLVKLAQSFEQSASAPSQPSGLLSRVAGLLGWRT